jgi:predicted HTH domain antitoxin
MKTITLELPDELEIEDFAYKIYLAGTLYEKGKLSLGQCAQMVGISKRAFIETMGHYGFSLFPQSIDETLSDLQNAQNYL